MFCVSFMIMCVDGFCINDQEAVCCAGSVCFFGKDPWPGFCVSSSMSKERRGLIATVAMVPSIFANV